MQQLFVVYIIAPYICFYMIYVPTICCLDHSNIDYRIYMLYLSKLILLKNIMYEM